MASSGTFAVASEKVEVSVKEGVAGGGSEVGIWWELYKN